ncbi:MFS transporter [Pseudomonas sp. GD03860]|uniref:MFS transporter n=1 Tax=Pseudomonas TaxID=286 RepID=UPI00236435CE|nr:MULTISPECIES: MFS transporter [Pseudomonas]MDD2058540.1 MFS transporter [Pseudomonas putida]MDH0640722.1 MFS transporter [Pseudomonas sp. GD03860]
MTPIEHTVPLAPACPAVDLRSIYRKVIWRLMPFLLVAFVINAIDRINISFAKLRMAEDIVLSDAAYGIGAGIFYFGYILFELPSNLYMQRVGARATLTRIMVLWGLVTVATAFVTSANQLIAARFFLGMAEAGFFPGVILYLTYWFPAALRGRITAAFMMAGVCAGIICGPLAGWIMTQFHGWLGLRDWQVLFVLTGAPAILLGLFGWFWLTDRPAQATWLSEDEKQRLAAELSNPGTASHGHLGAALRDPRLYIAGLVYFCIYSGSNTVSYWMPTLIRGFGLEDLRAIGMIATLPYFGAVCGMYLLGRSSDRRMERRWHLAGTLLVSAGCFALLGFVQGHLWLSVTLMSLGAAAALSAVPLFWTIPPAFLSAAGAAGGIAIISSLGNLAGVVSQSLVGAIKTATGNLYLAFDLIALALVLGAVALLIGIPAHCLNERRKAGQNPAQSPSGADHD